MATARTIVAHRNALVALARYLMQDRTGGVLTAALQMLTKVLEIKGAFAYRRQGGELELVSEMGLPRKAKAWLARLPIGEEHEPWFIAQRVARSLKTEVDSDLAASRHGLSLRPTLEAAGWTSLAAAPLAVGRALEGVIIVAAGPNGDLDKDELMMLEATGGILALAVAREIALSQAHNDRLQETRTAQLATMGVLAANVARDLASPLQAVQLDLDWIRSRTDSLRGDLRAGVDVAQMLAHLDELDALATDATTSMQRAVAITERLVELNAQTDPEVIDLVDIVHGGLVLLQRSFEEKGIAVTLVGDEHALSVEGRAEDLQMMVVQLLLFLTQEAEEVEDRRVLVTLDLEASDAVVTFESTTRQSKQASAQMFETHHRGSTPGVGLQLAKQCVTAHHGHIEVGASEDLGGPRFRVVLPAVVDPRTRSSRPSWRPSAPEPEAGGTRTLVWIEEDTASARSMARLFEGFTAHVVGSVREASLLLAQLDPMPELVLCDVALPDGLGIDLHKDAHPDLAPRFVFMTSAVLAEESARYLKTCGNMTLIKPVGADEIRALLSPDPEMLPAAPTFHPPPMDDEDNMPTQRPKRPPRAPQLDPIPPSPGIPMDFDWDD